jgi:uncharacterized membrane protein
VRGFSKDLNQPALVKARSWGLPVEIGILAGFGGRTTDMATLEQKVRLSSQRGHGVIYFFWEGLWGQFAGSEGPAYRRALFRQLHSGAFTNRPAAPPLPPPPLPAAPR